MVKKSKESAKSTRTALPYLQNRELSWLDFNKRVLDQGEDPNVPLLERITFVSIFSSNLQEFFMVRVGSLTDLSLVKKEIRDNKTLMTPHEQLTAIYDRCHELYPEQERIFNSLREELAENGICQLFPEDLNEEQKDYLHTYLQANVVPFLSPQIINSRHPFPHLVSGALYVLLRLDEKPIDVAEESLEVTTDKKKKKHKNVPADDALFGLIPLPSQAKRVIKLPGEGTQFILLEHALKTIVQEVFSMYKTKRASVICVTRNADIDASAIPEVDFDYREHMKRILKKRARLAPVRLETDTPLSPVTEAFLLPRLNIKQCQVFVTKVPLDMGYAWGLPDMIDKEKAVQLTSKPFTPQWPACLDEKRSIIEQVCEKEVLLQYPYESMDPFVQLLREAANDPQVVSIKITLYRLASQSHLAEALVQAAENGKEVTALFELRARFDESNNIEWSQRFEEAGAHVIYGFHDLKVHSKICTITRRTDKGIQHITQLGTGNYNEKTSKLYTDFSFITTDEGIGKDAAEFFRNMSLENASDSYNVLRVAPLQIKPKMMEKIDEQIKLAQEGKPNGLIFKTNSVTDKEIIDKIAEASQAGVHTTLFVRGISCIVPGVEGYTENVEVVSIVGRLLEHSRIYAFGPVDEMEIYLSSADLMTRNMDKRIEIAWPINDEKLKQKVIDYLDISFSDTAKLRKLNNTLEYTPLGFFAETNEDGTRNEFNSQEYLIKKAAEDYTTSVKEREELARARAAQARAQRLKDAEKLMHAASVLAAKKEIEEIASIAEVGEAQDSIEATQTLDAVANTTKTAQVSEEVDQANEAQTAETTQIAEEVLQVAESQEPEEPAKLESVVIPENTVPTSAQNAATQQKPTETYSSQSINDVIKAAGEEPVVISTSFDNQAAQIEESSPNESKNTPVQEASPEVISETVITPNDMSVRDAIQLIEKKPPKASLWTRIKFLFTGRLN